LIRNPTGFIIGVAQQADKGLEDFGYLMEIAVLSATDLGLGTCWLGGSFSRSGFAGKIEIRDDEVLPAVVSTGYSASPDGSGDLIRKGIGATSRLPWEDLFFEDRFGNPLAREAAGAHAPAVDGVREGPSASNKQPWRIIKQGDAWHFYLQRTPGYRNALLTRLMRVEDLQRVDMGIAMSHFEIMAAESDLRGRWTVAEPDIDKPDEDTEYTVTWINR
jgi:hypothetical protein